MCVWFVPIPENEESSKSHFASYSSFTSTYSVSMPAALAAYKAGSSFLLLGIHQLLYRFKNQALLFLSFSPVAIIQTIVVASFSKPSSKGMSVCLFRSSRDFLSLFSLHFSCLTLYGKQAISISLLFRVPLHFQVLYITAAARAATRQQGDRAKAGDVAQAAERKLSCYS